MHTYNKLTGVPTVVDQELYLWWWHRRCGNQRKWNRGIRAYMGTRIAKVKNGRTRRL